MGWALGDAVHHALIELDEAMAKLDEQFVRIVESCFFGGLNSRDAAEVLLVPLRTLERGWATARSWLRGRSRTGGGSQCQGAMS